MNGKDEKFKQQSPQCFH